MQTQTSKKQKRPFGIYVLLAGFVALALSNGVDLWRVWQEEPPHELPDLGFAVDLIVSAAVVVFFIVLSVGLWRMQAWAWFLAMIAGGLALFWCIWRSFDGATPYLTMLLVVIMVFYLNLTEVKAAFQNWEQAR